MATPEATMSIARDNGGDDGEEDVCYAVPVGDAPHASVRVEALGHLFREYAALLLENGADIHCFQFFDTELAGLPGKYAPAQGGSAYILVAAEETAPVQEADGQGRGRRRMRVERLREEEDQERAEEILRAALAEADVATKDDEAAEEDNARQEAAQADADGGDCEQAGAGCCRDIVVDTSFDPRTATARAPRIVGCVGHKKLDDETAELKRLFIRSAYARRGLGCSASQTILDLCKERGYSKIYLDTLRRLPGALQLYQGMGFDEIPAYYENPEPDVVFMAKNL